MKRILFQPFAADKWFVLGFSAWLAGLVDSGGSGGSGGGGGGGDAYGDEEAEEFDEMLREAGEWARENLEIILAVGAIVLAVVFAVVVVLLWVSSRGKFMFLDNLVHNRALVAEPWKKFRATGNSLFRWRVGFTLVVLAGVLLFCGAFAWFLVGAIQAGEWAGSDIAVVVAFGLCLIAILLVISYIATMLEDFVIPMMYRDSLASSDAWRNFLSLHGSAPGRFVLYFFWRFLLGIVSAAVIIAAGLATCCIGFLLMAIPYFGAVILLPVTSFFRLLGPEFLRQFGPEFEIFEPVTPSAPPVLPPR